MIYYLWTHEERKRKVVGPFCKTENVRKIAGLRQENAWK